MTADGGWQDILPPGERLLWHDRPRGSLTIADFLTGQLLFGGVFTAFAAFWISAVSWIGRDLGGFNFMPYFGIPFILVGLHVMIGQPIWEAYERTRSWYALTDQAGYIATELLGKRKLRRYPIVGMNGLELEDGAIGTVWFQRNVEIHRTTRRNRNGSAMRRSYPVTSKTGFTRIASPRMVYRLIVRQLSKNDNQSTI